MNPATALFLSAPAKLNLVLRIVGRRADGYHLLETVFHAIDLADDLWLARGPLGHGIDLRVSADSPPLLPPAGADNLVARALVAFAKASQASADFVVHLHKRIPAGGGLGGGSSDAAAALRLANRALGEPLDPATLHRLAAGLGADVPFFLAGCSQLGRGVGDELETVDVPDLHFVLVLPPFGCPTAEVYKNYAALWHGSAPQDSFPDVTGANFRDLLLGHRSCNDLEPAAERIRPALGQLRQRIAALGYPSVHMTGSGSTLFVAQPDAAAAAQCLLDLQGLCADGVRLTTAASAGAGPAIREVRWPLAAALAAGVGVAPGKSGPHSGGG